MVRGYTFIEGEFYFYRYMCITCVLKALSHVFEFLENA